MFVILFESLVLTIGLLVPIAIAVFGVFAFWSEIKGAPFVPTSKKLLTEILSAAQLKKGQHFLELGSGDGRVTRFAVSQFGVVGEGVDVHPMLIWYANFQSRRSKLKAVFKRADFFKIDLKKADVIFVFLLPRTMKKLAPKFLRECKKGTMIISHGFSIAGLEDKLIKTQKRSQFSTHFYRL